MQDLFEINRISLKFISLKLLLIKKVLEYLEGIMYLLPHYMALIWTKQTKKLKKNLFLKVLKVRRPGRKTSGFRTVRILKICRTGRDVR